MQRATTRTLAVVLLLGLLSAGCTGPAAPPSQPATERATFLRVASFDGHQVPITVYRPDTTETVPVVLHSHGWGGQRETRLDAFRAFTDAGLAVVSIDMRGHGEARANSQARVANPEYEIRDVQAVIDSIASQDWARSEPSIPTNGTGAADGSGPDLVLGAMGESYGGASPLLTAGLDARLDAVVARDTWHDLEAALAPNGVAKTAWIGSLWISAAVQARMHPDVRAGFEAATRTGVVPDGSGGLPDLKAALAASSPRGSQVAIPVLFVQGMDDTLFDLGQAMDNVAQVRKSGGQATLVTHLGGHSLDTPVQGTQSDRPSRHPCGDPDDLALVWFRVHLLQEKVAPPIACVALPDDQVVPGSIPDLPKRLFGAPAIEVRVGDPSASNTYANLTVDGSPPGGAALAFGRPVLTATMDATNANGTLYVSVAAQGEDGAASSRAHVTPVRITPGEARRIEIPLAALAQRVEGGLALGFAPSDPLYGTYPSMPGIVRLSDIRLAVPLCDACASITAVPDVGP